MADRPAHSTMERLLGVTTLAVILVAIEASVWTGSVNGFIVPAPSRILTRSFELVASGEVFLPLATTLYLLFAAYFIASALAILLGILMGRFPAIYNLFEPLIEGIRPLPKAALLPLLILLLGLGDTMKLTVIGLAVFFPVLINTIQGVQGVDPTLVNTARTFGYGTGAILYKVVLPAAMPLIAAGMRVSLALALILAVITEMITGTKGLGYLIVDMQRSFKVLDMYAWLVVLAIVGYLLNAIFIFLERRGLHWASTRE